MIDTSLVAFAIGFIVLAAATGVAAVAAIVVALRDLRTETPTVVSISGPSDVDARYAA